ncbi:MAG: helix-turn-helix domain-containing protein [Clostridia bacterium]|nr:helix-turn-helix domain-containing protein [Clostridia bacterium]
MQDTIGSNIRRCRKQKGVTQRGLADAIGKSFSSIQKYELDLAVPPVSVIHEIADALGVEVWEILGVEHGAVEQERLPSNVSRLPQMRQIPVLGSIACGTPIMAEENVEGYVAVQDGLHCHFALRCKGDSMATRVMDGDIVYIRQQPDVQDGQIAAVLIDDEATLKHVYHIPGGVQLVADNPAYAPLIYTGEDCAGLRILGLAVAYQRML